MGQREVIEYLNTRRCGGYNGYTTVQEIVRATGEGEKSVYAAVQKLLSAGFLERNIPYGFCFGVRLRRKYVRKSETLENVPIEAGASMFPISGFKKKSNYPESEAYE